MTDSAVGTQRGPIDDPVGTQRGPIDDPVGTQRGPIDDPVGTQRGPIDDPVGTQRGPIDDPVGTQRDPVATPLGGGQVGREVVSTVDGGPDLIQLLTPDGQRLEHPEYSPYVEHLGPEDLRGFYRDLVLIRRVDSEATALQRQGELGIWASLLGQEAAQIGSGRALSPQDHAFPTYREHGVAWCKGVDPVDLLGLFRGVHHGSWDPAEKNIALYTIVIGAQTLHATGYAMAIQRDGDVGTGDPTRDAAAIAYFGDGATAQGDVNEAFVFASVQHAPVVFFCQNNQWAISEPNDRQTTIPLYRRAHGFGIPGVRVDGNDVLAVYAVTRAALERAHSGSGPSMIEAFTYRMGAHTTSDDPTRYRVAAEVEVWKDRDPIVRLRTHLVDTGAADDAFFASVDVEADELATRLRAQCLAMPDPEPDSMFAHAYAHEQPLVELERAQFAAYRESFVTQEVSA